MKIIIIETGTLDEALEARFGDYPHMFADLLKAEGLELEICRLVRGEDLPALDAADGFLITGSKHGVYDDLPWMEPLKAFIRACAQARKPLIGVCFGHQIMAEALGGKVEKSEKGWGLGPHSYHVNASSALKDAPETLTVQAVHQDQITVQPPDSTVICQSEFCEYAGLLYGDAPYALSLQAHPEFATEFVTALVTARRGQAYSEAIADEALARMGTPLDRQKFAKWFADFYRAAASS